MTTASSAAPSAEVTAIDASARCPLLLLLGAALLWLVVSGALALLNLLQLSTPSLAADCAVMTFGRTAAMQQTAFLYGWAANAGLAVVLWLLGRLGGSPLRSLNWTVAGALFWNLSVALSLVGIGTGDGASHAWLHLPAYVQPLMLVAYAAMVVPGVLAWTNRRQPMMFAAQWYAVAALVLFPWIFSGAQLMLSFAPERGVLQALVAGWFGQGAWSLWLAPLALAAAYYLVPKVGGRAIPSYDFAILSFWTLIFVGSWTGGRHLIGGPVPAWTITVAGVACVLLLFHYIVVGINLRGAFACGGSTVLRFIALGLGAYLLGGLGDALTAFRGVAVLTQFTHLATAQSQLALTGAFSLTIFGAIYFMVPRLTGQAWPSGSLIRGHFFAALLGTLILIGALAVAGWIQGQDLNDATVSFAAIATHTQPWLLIAAAGQAVLVVGNGLLLVHLVRAIACRWLKPAPAIFPEAPTMEVSRS